MLALKKKSFTSPRWIWQNPELRQGHDHSVQIQSKLLDTQRMGKRQSPVEMSICSAKSKMTQTLVELPKDFKSIYITAFWDKER